MKRIAAALMALMLLGGCASADLESYPWVAPSKPAPPQMSTVSLTLPEDSDDILTGAMVMLDAKVQELSEGNVKLETFSSPNMLDDYRDGGQGLYLLSSGQMEQLDERLRFTQMPFLFPERENLFAMLNNSGNAINRSRVTAERLQGEAIGVYYGGTTWMIGRTKFYDEVGFYNSVGVLAGMAGNSCFSAIGGENIVEGSDAEIMQAFALGDVKYCELVPGTALPGQTLKAAKYIELTNHRYNGWWLVLKNPENALENATIALLREAFSYTIGQQDSQRLALEEEEWARLEVQYRIPVNTEETYRETRQRARRYYRENWKSLGIAEDIWRDIAATSQ